MVGELSGDGFRLRPPGRASMTTGANTARFSHAAFPTRGRPFRRHPNNCCGVNPCLRATADTVSPVSYVSETIRAFCSELQRLRRPAPVNTSSRRTGSGSGLGLSKSSVSDMCPTSSFEESRSDNHRLSSAKGEGCHKTAYIFLDLQWTIFLRLRKNFPPIYNLHLPSNWLIDSQTVRLEWRGQRPHLKKKNKTCALSLGMFVDCMSII